MTNRLKNETSPYLIQHAENPVDWYPWGDEALEKAQQEDKPVFLSIGYAACHWCHVMAHESFEDPETAQILNEHFVSIKVDREERPDLDGIYMNAVVTMTGQGGWPMSVFLTPQGEPFFGGTYFPPTRRHGLPSFREVLNAIAHGWHTERGEMVEAGQKLAQHLSEGGAWGDQSGAVLRPDTLQQATQALINNYDWEMGGWGRAPRFPQPMSIEVLLLQSTRGAPKALNAAVHNLDMMSRGGLYDVVGGGFHRYATDDHWLVPHFEKMLYDNAQLALAYLHAALLTDSIHFRAVCTETLDFILREMTHPLGGFYSSLDADSEGVEGKYYVWSPDEVKQALDEDDQALFGQVYGVTERGNFEGKNILQRQVELPVLAGQMDLSESGLLDRLNTIHKKLYAAREQRIRPATDDKVLVSWNALALRAFAEAARFLQRPDYLDAARKNAAFLLDHMVQEGRLLRAWRDGKARHNAYLEDHAALILGLLALYQSDPDPRWYQGARWLAKEMMDHFRDTDGGFFDTRADHGTLIARPKEIQDNATPSGNALAVNALLQLAAYEEQPAMAEMAEKSLAVLQELMVRHPTAFAQWLQGFDFASGPVHQVAIIGPMESGKTRALIEALWETYRPRTLLAAASAPLEPGSESDPTLLHNRPMQQGQPTAYVCQHFTCNLPVTDVEGLKQQLQS